MSGNELGPVSRSLVDAARGGLGPDPDAAARVRAKVAAAITGGGVAAAASAKAAAATAGSTAAPAGSGFAIKLAVAVLVGGAIVGGVVATRGSRQQPPPPPIVEPAITVDERPAADVRLSVSDGTAGQPETGRPESGSVPRSPKSEPRTPVRPAPGQSPSEILGQEVRLIDQASAALREGRFDDALAAIQIYDENIGERGQLTEDAAAIQIEATCRLHGASADRLAEFDRKWPSSAQRARLAAACATH